MQKSAIEVFFMDLKFELQKRLPRLQYYFVGRISAVVEKSLAWQ